MQPETNSQPSFSAEQLPVQPVVTPEAVPSLPPVEVQVGRGQEAYEQRAETTQFNTAPAQVPLQQPVVPQAPQPPQSAPAQTVGAPMIAADEELIEKEWVDKAKQIIAHTADDPFSRSAQVSELQRSYLQKRYGKVVGTDA